MFTKEERLFIWKKVYEEIERLEDGNYICVMLRNIVFKFFSTPKKIESFYGLYLDKMVKHISRNWRKRKVWLQNQKKNGGYMDGLAVLVRKRRR